MRLVKPVIKSDEFGPLSEAADFNSRPGLHGSKHKRAITVTAGKLMRGGARTPKPLPWSRERRRP